MLTQLLEMNSLVFLAATKRGQISLGLVVVCIAIVLTIGVAVGTYLFMRNRKPSLEEQSRSLFRELCRAHQLTSAQCKLVMRLAKGLKLNCPASLFVDSNTWRIPEDSGDGSLDRKDWEKLQTIQKMLFMPALAKI
jgi:hypothetical protein